MKKHYRDAGVPVDQQLSCARRGLRAYGYTRWFWAVTDAAW